MVYSIPPILMLIFCNTALCKDLGCFGSTFLIQEESLLSYIFERLKALDKRGDLQKHNEIIQKKVVDRLHHPDPVRVCPIQRHHADLHLIQVLLYLKILRITRVGYFTHGAHV